MIENNPTIISKNIALVGNPNVGKSIFFNYFSGKYVDVSNFPGTTVEVYSAKYKNMILYDTPGIYSVASFNDEEKVAKEYILGADLIINVVDANHLERDLFLTLQLLEMGKKVIVALNIIDELEKNNIRIDIERLKKNLGIAIIPTIATEGIGFIELEKEIEKSLSEIQNPINKIKYFKRDDIPQAEELLILEGDEQIAKKYGITQKFNRDELYFSRRRKVNDIASMVLVNKKGKQRLSGIIGYYTIHPVWGIPIGLLILYVIYLFIGVFVAGDVVDYTKNYIGNNIYEKNLKMLIAKNASTVISFSKIQENGDISKYVFSFPEGTENDTIKFNQMNSDLSGKWQELDFNFTNPLLTILFGEFGVLSMTISYILFLLLPLILGFYFMLSVLEDSGYLPRLAALVDNILNRIGLNGKAIIPIILGFGCVTMATITTRMLGSKRERTIATTILQLAIPCSAQLGVIATLLARTELRITIIYVIIIFVFLALIGTILSKLIPGESTPLLIDLPKMRLPRMNNLMKKTIFKSYSFIKEASPWFFFGALLISLFQVTGILQSIINFIHPLIVHWLKLPPEAGIAFVMGLVRRDFGAAGLYDLVLSPFQILVSLVTLTLFVPCITSLIIMFKERGAKEGGFIWFSSLTLAFLIGGIIAQIVL